MSSRPYPRDKATAHRILTMHLASHYQVLWDAEKEQDARTANLTSFAIMGFTVAAEALGLDGVHVASMAQRFNSLTEQEKIDEYGDLLDRLAPEEDQERAEVADGS